MIKTTRLTSLVAALILFIALGGVVSAEKLYVPPFYLLKDDISKQNEINSKLEIENCLPLVEAGLIEVGWIDLDDPNVRFQLAYNRWLKLWNEAVAQGSLSYEEVLAFNRMVNRFETFVERVERQRKRGF